MGFYCKKPYGEMLKKAELQEKLLNTFCSKLCVQSGNVFPQFLIAVIEIVYLDTLRPLFGYIVMCAQDIASHRA